MRWSATVTSGSSAPVSLASLGIESASEATNSSASRSRCSLPVSTSSGCTVFFGDEEELDVPERGVLRDVDALAADEFEDGEEGHDDGYAVESGAQPEERGAAGPAERPRDHVHLFVERHALADDGSLLGLGGAERGRERAGELGRVDPIALHEVGGGVAAVGPQEVRGGLGGTPFELLAGVAVRRVRDQPVAQPRLDRLGGLLGIARQLDRDRRQQRLRLQEHQRRRDDEVIRRELDVEGLHGLDVGEVLIGHEREGDRRDIELALLDQVQEQVERAVEDVEREVEPGLSSGVGQQTQALESPTDFAAVTVSGSKMPLPSCSSHSKPRSTRRFSLTYLSAFLAALISNQRASSTSWSWLAVSPDR